ncbi:MAG: HAD-IIIC family phosphatase [Gemmatimonadota bacterium]
MTRRLRALTLSDFNASNFEAYLTNDPDEPPIEAIESDFGQVSRLVADPGAAVWSPRPDLTMIWTRPEGVIASFARLCAGEEVDDGEVLREVDAWLDLVAGVRKRTGVVFVPTWTPPGRSIFPSQEMDLERGIDGMLLRMNLRLAKRLGGLPGVHVLNATRWAAGPQSFSPKLWYMSKTPYANEVFRSAVSTIKAALRGLAGAARKLIILDLDDTLWGGIVGEVGWERVILGGHDPIGEAYVDFQLALKALTRRGIVLGIVSRNEEAVALEAIRRNPEMVLRLDDFAGWRIDWGDKARNVADLVDELNLGLQSTVFIDDDPAQRARVAEALPEVLVPDWPQDRMLYRRALEDLGCFDAPAISEEDRGRAAMYVVERNRREARSTVGTVDEWLETLGTVVTVEPLGPGNLPRAAQLLNKTNQMNLSTRRMSEIELGDWAAAAERAVWTFRVSDRFGDLGLTGILGLEEEDGRGRVVDFVLSCRAFGRKVEETMLAIAVREARSRGLVEVVAEYRPTARNRPCLEFLRRCGFAERNATIPTFVWDCDRPYGVPDTVRLEDPAGALPRPSEGAASSSSAGGSR